MSEEGSISFLKKRNKKLLLVASGGRWPVSIVGGARRKQKFFGSFFQKRTASLLPGFPPARLKSGLQRALGGERR
jgi:hypothetical protein